MSKQLTVLKKNWLLQTQAQQLEKPIQHPAPEPIQQAPKRVKTPFDDVYPMNASTNGFCLIFNIENYLEQYSEYSDRFGSEEDTSRLEKLFKRLNYHVITKKNLKAREILKKVNDMAFDTDHSKMDCFVCCILAHGESGGRLFSTDGTAFTLSQITSNLTANICKSLSGKPKIFIIQACRGEEVQTARNYCADAGCPGGVTIPDQADFFIGYATVAGFKAHRHRTEGSVYIQTLCGLMEEHAEKVDIQRLFIKLHALISRMEFDGPPGAPWKVKQIPEVKHTLTKNFKFA